ncbi:MAG: glucosyltransferase domain-containing protein, partial [Roseburia sp.]|nr:glucosyltransferase domain-containing protein [Roseburia sp.]
MAETVRKYSSRMMVMGLFVFLVHGSKLNSGIIGIDTENMINMGEGFYRGWLETGRQGLVGLKWLLGTISFNPYYAGLMTLVCLVMAAGAFLFLWEQASGGERLCMTGFLLAAAVWFSHPVTTEQLYFSLQSMEICV